MNGSQGIAVGMATNIAPHNMGEAVEATCYLIDHPDATVDELMQIMPGPDFPTGALIMGTDGIRQSYETGRGEATCYLIDHPDATVDELMQIMPGPDFPTGALIMGTDGIRQSYETGRGSITGRAKAHVESTKTGVHQDGPQPPGVHRDPVHGE